MSRNKTVLTIIGFVLAGIGFLAIFLALVGVDFSYLFWLRQFGPLAAFGAKVAMVLAGFIFIYFGQVDLSEEEVF